MKVMRDKRYGKDVEHTLQEKRISRRTKASRDIQKMHRKMISQCIKAHWNQGRTKCVGRGSPNAQHDASGDHGEHPKLFIRRQKIITVASRVLHDLLTHHGMRVTPQNFENDPLPLVKYAFMIYIKMLPRRGACRSGRRGRGRGVVYNKPDGQLVVHAVNLAALVTHADLAAMEQRNRALTTRGFSASILIEGQSLKDAKLQEFLELQQSNMTVEQYDLKFNVLSFFVPKKVATKATKADKFVRGFRLDLQGFVRAFRPANHANVEYTSLHERTDPSKIVGKGSTSGKKRKAKQ
ncbi:gag-protease polyprotein [Cucumis melo var. makuwa]|uniref:Gag-protease polyprotein n=1 Tax=Cucumis melo var. makuwa TaxID=1194695 RepID=A0A5D3DQC2_CUCMM|nr:gag-protease polyprotein [Cucumis melo var. makuwa]